MILSASEIVVQEVLIAKITFCGQFKINDKEIIQLKLSFNYY